MRSVNTEKKEKEAKKNTEKLTKMHYAKNH